ncbi:MAG: hypothetical protein EOM53_03640 [Alphaproteobacteria bacterium]|nr:hypothetical protein [Alphaproteobacteria bacterium]
MSNLVHTGAGVQEILREVKNGAFASAVVYPSGKESKESWSLGKRAKNYGNEHIGYVKKVKGNSRVA